MMNFFKKIIKFLTEGIWQKKESEYDTRFQRISAKQLKVFIYTAKSYWEDQMVVRCAALTFYTLMSLVPIAAIIFGIAKGFNFETRITQWLYNKFPQYEGLVDQLTEFAHAMLERTKGGLVASLGFVTLMWAVVRVFNNIERTFNHIWEVHKSRTFTRKLSDYLSVVIISPIFWALSTLVTDRLGLTLLTIVDGTLFTPLFHFLDLIVPLFILWLMLTVLYYVMPNTKVKLGPAFKGAIMAGTVLYVFQWGYFYFQSSLSSYNAIYGSFAAVPLFLIWLHVSWQIVMFGAELSFGYQNIRKYEFERDSFNISYDYKRKILLLVMHRIAYNFHRGTEEMDSDQLATVLNLPVRIVRDVLYELEEAHLIVAVEDDANKTIRYYPSRDVSEMRIHDIIRIVESSGVENFSMDESVELGQLNELFRNFDSQIERSGSNVLLLDIRTEENKGCGE